MTEISGAFERTYSKVVPAPRNSTVPDLTTSVVMGGGFMAVKGGIISAPPSSKDHPRTAKEISHLISL